MTRLAMLDRSFLTLESGPVTGHVGLVATFTPPAGAESDFVTRVVAELRGRRTAVAPFNYRLKRSPWRWLLPSWEELGPDELDLEHHLQHHALPSPGGQRELGVLVSRLHSRPLDRDRPLWEYNVIEGLEDGRFAVYFKVHQALMDGVSAAAAFTRTLTSDPTDQGIRAFWSMMALEAVDGGAPAKADRTRPPRPTGRSRLYGSKAHPVLNGRVSRHRRVATRSYDLARMKAVGKAANASVNDVFLAMGAHALREYFPDLASQSRQLTTAAPVSLRGMGGNTGNAVGVMAVALHTDIDDALARLALINRSSTAAKDGLARWPDALRPHQSAIAATPLLVQSLLGVAGRGIRSHGNIVMSNVPGPLAPQFFGGATLDEAHPLSMLIHGQALNFTAFSAGGKFHIGIVGCR